MFLRSVLQLLVSANVVPSSLILSIQLVFLRSVLQLLVAVNVVPSSLIVVSLIMEAILSPETSVLIRVTRRNIPEDTILHSHRRQNLKSYTCVIIYHLYSCRMSLQPAASDSIVK
jgi:hypothetical protein